MRQQRRFGIICKSYSRNQNYETSDKKKKNIDCVDYPIKQKLFIKI